MDNGNNKNPPPTYNSAEQDSFPWIIMNNYRFKAILGGKHCDVQIKIKYQGSNPLIVNDTLT